MKNANDLLKSLVCEKNPDRIDVLILYFRALHVDEIYNIYICYQLDSIRFIVNVITYACHVLITESSYLINPSTAVACM